MQVKTEALGVRQSLPVPVGVDRTEGRAAGSVGIAHHETDEDGEQPAQRRCRDDAMFDFHVNVPLTMTAYARGAHLYGT